uniref:Uncharacterized protein n=1 Tax=Arundo donax TaxID=35708 RepID=A0A0A9D5V5_ARUDO
MNCISQMVACTSMGVLTYFVPVAAVECTNERRIGGTNISVRVSDWSRGGVRDLLRRPGAAVDGHGGAVAGEEEEEAAGDAHPEPERGEDADLPRGARLAEEVERHHPGLERPVHVPHPVGAERPPRRHHLVPQRHGAPARHREGPGAQHGHLGSVEAHGEVDAGEGRVGLGVGVLGQDGERQHQVLDGARAVVLQRHQPRVGHQQVRHLGLVQQVHSEHGGAGDDDADGQHRAQDHHRPHHAGALAPVWLRDPLRVLLLLVVARPHVTPRLSRSSLSPSCVHGARERGESIDGINTGGVA